MSNFNSTEYRLAVKRTEQLRAVTKERDEARAAAAAWRELATARAILLVAHDPARDGGVTPCEYAQALEDEERAIAAVMQLPKEYRL